VTCELCSRVIWVGCSTGICRGSLAKIFMEDAQFKLYADRLGVGLDVSAVELERVWMRKSFTTKQSGDTAGWEHMREAFVALQPVVQVREQAAARVRSAQAQELKAGRTIERWAQQEMDERAAAKPSAWDPRSFESPWINALALPLVIGLAWGFNQLPLAFLMQGLKIWIHEFGHATVAWMSGFKALPLPIGWTNISPEKQDFVYWGVLFLLGVFFWAGWKEQRYWPVFIAPPLALLQWHMTWQVEDWQIEQWIDFGGVGGEYYLSAMMVAAFFFELPEKFRWGSCRYVFLFIGAAAFWDIYNFWIDVAKGVEEIPWGSMIHGEDDQGGDMNKLRDGWGWAESRIIGTYVMLGNGCAIAVGAVYLFFNLRLNRLPIWIIDRLRGAED
jgi:hypothetical protein